MRALLDVNFLIALLDPLNTSHATANDWLDAHFTTGWASCPLTENGYLRVLTNLRYANSISPEVALARLRVTKASGNHAFWADDISITDMEVVDQRFLRGHQQVTDIYLLALAVAHGGQLVTFDRRIQREAVVGCGAEHLVVL